RYEVGCEVGCFTGCPSPWPAARSWNDTNNAETAIDATRRHLQSWFMSIQPGDELRDGIHRSLQVLRLRPPRRRPRLEGVIAVGKENDSDRRRQLVALDLRRRAEGVARPLDDEGRRAELSQMRRPQALRGVGRMEWIAEADETADAGVVRHH